MQYTLTVSLSTLRAARTHSANGDIRYYLNGVYLDTKTGKVIATDGHRMLCATARGVKRDAAPVVVPNELIDAALKQFGGEYARGKALGACDVSITIDGRAVTIATPTGHVSGLTIDGQFPDWRRVVPQGEPAVLDSAPAVLNSDYVTDACAAFAIARNISKAKSGIHAVRVLQRGNNSAIVCDTDPDMVVIIMPLRDRMANDAPLAACAMAHVDAIPYSDETAERVALEAAAAVSSAA
jgi:DNA polymerase III sliding clamp (beta) subunit (PCNA family)